VVIQGKDIRSVHEKLAATNAIQEEPWGIGYFISGGGR